MRELFFFRDRCWALGTGYIELAGHCLILLLLLLFCAAIAIAIGRVGGHFVGFRDSGLWLAFSY